MLVVETVVRIRREYAGGKAIKAIRAPEGAFDYHRAVQPLPRIAPFQERLDALLAENETRHRRDRLRMTWIHDLLRREGFEGSYDAVRRYAARWSAARVKVAHRPHVTLTGFCRCGQSLRPLRCQRSEAL